MSCVLFAKFQNSIFLNYIELCSNHHNLVLERFHHSQSSLLPICCQSMIPPQAPGNHGSEFCLSKVEVCIFKWSDSAVLQLSLKSKYLHEELGFMFSSETTEGTGYLSGLGLQICGLFQSLGVYRPCG